MRSPWLEKLPKRKHKQLKRDAETDVLIVGAGIAGISTAYYLLKDTKHRVIVVDQGLLAHGATGHNAGQIVSYFETGFRDLVSRYGIELAAQAQRDILSAWDLIDRIVADLRITAPLSFAGFAGISSMPLLISHLEDRRLQAQAQLDIEHLYVLNDELVTRLIPPQFEGLYSLVARDDLAAKLHTEDTQYIAALSSRKGCLNSARFCHEVVRALEQRSADRFVLYEKSPIHHLSVPGGVIATGKAKIHAQHVVLCTNGFSHIPVEQMASPDKLVHGLVGYMRAHVEKRSPPSATSYLQADTDAYFYVTRRPHGVRSLVCTGGPEVKIVDKYNPRKHYVADGPQRAADFFGKTFGTSPKAKYEWEGLMGYTRTNLRCIGAHPLHSRLLYNLGCNGTGILPSVYGAKRISLLLQGKKLGKSVFDPALHFT